MEKYKNRIQAGITLAEHLQSFADRKDVIVLALPRGGVPVAYEIAISLHVALDVFIVRKLGVPGHNELAMGAIAPGNTIVFNHKIISELDIQRTEIDAVIASELTELQRRELAYRGHNAFPAVKAKIIILVDDGIATGATMRVAIKALRQLKPASIVVAVPVADKQMCDELTPMVEQFICPLRPTELYAVGKWYEDFSQTEDTEVYELLDTARHRVD